MCHPTSTLLAFIFVFIIGFGLIGVSFRQLSPRNRQRFLILVLIFSGAFCYASWVFG